MFEAFAVAVTLRLTDGVTGGLLGMSRRFHQAHGDADALQKKLTSIGRMMVVGAGMTAAGLGIIGAFRPAVEEAEKFQQQVAQFTLFNMGDAANRDAVSFVKAMDVQGSSYVDNMKRMVEAQGIFRESAKLTRQEQLAGAKLAAPVLAKIGFIADALDGDKAASEKASAQAMLRFIELRGGATDPRRFNELANAGFKAIRSSGGNVSWELLRQFATNAGTAGQHLRDDVLFGKFEPLLGELKGQAGVGWQTAFSRLEGVTKPPNQVIHSMVSMGIWDPKKIIWNNQGGVKSFVPDKGGLPGNPLIDSKLWSEDPFEAYEKYVRSRYEKFRVSADERARDNLLFFGRTGGKLFNIYERQRAVVGNSVAVQAKTMGIDQASKVAAGTLAGQQVIAAKAFHDSLELTGEALMPLATRIMQTVLPGLRSLNAWMQAHPALFDKAIQSFVALGGVLVAGGVATNIIATFRALGLLFSIMRTAAIFSRVASIVSVGFELVEVAFAGLAIVIGAPVGVIVGVGVAIAAVLAGVGVALFQMWKHWDNSRSVIDNLKAELGMFFDWIKGIPGAIWSKVPGWLRNILGGGAPKTPATAAAPKPGQPAAPKPITYRQANGRLDVRATVDFLKKGAPLIAPADWLKEHPAAVAAGKAVGQGVAQGVIAAHPAVRAATTGTAHQAVDAFRKATDQHSPSRVFAGLGDMLIAGLIVGVERSAPGLLSRLSDLGRAAMGTMRGLGGAGGDFTQRLTSSVTERASQAMAFFKAHGWSGAQAAGIVSNLVRESGLNAAAVNARSGAYGVTQWLGSRVRDFAAFTGHTLRGSSLLDQLRFTDHELRTTHASVGRALLAARTPGAAAALINGRFEINGVAGEGGRRAALAAQLASTRFGDMSAQPSRSPYVQSGRAVEVTVHHRTTLDGRVLTETVTRHMAKDGRRPQSSSNHFDPTMAPMWSGQRMAPS